MGQGAEGSVVLAKKIKRSKTKGIERVAIKCMNKNKFEKNKNSLENFYNEIRVHWALYACENALKLLRIYESNESIYLVLEY